jgi:hypothetical protein
MSRNLPVPIRSERLKRRGQSDRAVRTPAPEVIVLDDHRSGSPGSASFVAHPLARLAIGLAPDVLRAIERSMAQRRDASLTSAPVTRADTRSWASGFQLSEVEYDTRVPLVRKVTVRKAAAWTADFPTPTPTRQDDRRGGGRLRAAGLVSAGALGVAVVSLIVRGVGNLSRAGWRR